MGRSFWTPDGVRIPLDGLAADLRQESPFGTNWFAADAGELTDKLGDAEAGDTLFLAPGEYDSALTIARAKSNLTLVGLGGRGAVALAPSAVNASALTIEADDVTIVNVGCDGAGTGSGLVNRGRRTRAFGSKIEGGAVGLKLTLGTQAQIDAETHGDGSDTWFVDCEIAWNTKGVEVVASNYGAVTQARFRDCLFHDNATADFEESGGSAGVRFRDLDIGRCKFSRQEDGTEPGKYLSLNDDNANTGMVWESVFPSALNGGKNLVSTALLWVANRHIAGLSNGQPS